MRTPRAAYPLTWRVMDALERLAAMVWPARFGSALPYLMLLPALLLVGLLVLGLVEIGDTSLRTLDTSTFLLSDVRTLDNYRRVLTEPFFLTVASRSLIGALIVTAVTLIFAFPYAYLMVRTPSSGLRKLLLVALFLPFFIGQVVRRAFGLKADFAEQSKALAANQGLYNGFLAAGLAWGVIQGAVEGRPWMIFFAGCVVVAGVFGAATASRKILFVQALPGALTLAAALAA